jgi:hypothetical protein
MEHLSLVPYASHWADSSDIVNSREVVSKYVLRYNILLVPKLTLPVVVGRCTYQGSTFLPIWECLKRNSS